MCSPQLESAFLAAVCAQVRQASNLSHLGFGRHRTLFQYLAQGIELMDM